MIYCVEDDDNIRELMIYALRASNLEAEGLRDAKELFTALERCHPELITLDIMLPGMDGIKILKRLRTNPATERIPVIMASAKGTEYDKVLGLDLGADDYLVKPFSMMEMVSRIRAVLRRVAPVEKKVIRLGQLELDPDAHVATCQGVTLDLTNKEFKLLRLFMSHPGRVYSRDLLLEKVWGEDYLGETRTVDVHIGTLRTKLGDCGDYIRTVRGVGYRMEERR